MLENGLTLILHEDMGTQLAAVNILYKAGARDEEPGHTGFAHLFEHLMFGGSEHVPAFDTELQLAGGTNNAFTTNDLTNYYDVLPAQNLETALWLESDRMRQLDFSEKSLEVQRNVVSEEFKEHYINRPYGDLWHKLRKLVYEIHPYQWPTIGLELSHIRNAKLDDVKHFFYTYYRPQNAILVIAGGITIENAEMLAKKWFGDIPPGKPITRNIPSEPEQKEAKFLAVEADVPVNVIYKVWKMAGRAESDFYPADMLSSMLGSGDAARLNQALKKEKKLFSDISCYVTGSIDTGMFVITGKLAEGTSWDAGEAGIAEEIAKIRTTLTGEKELQRMRNAVEMDVASGYTGVLNKAQGLAMAEMLGDADLVNSEITRFLNVSREDILHAAQDILDETKCSTMHYGKLQG